MQFFAASTYFLRTVVAYILLYCAAVGFADGLTSDNVVGYTAKEAEQGKFLIIGAQFENVADGSMKINDLVSGVAGVDYDDQDVWMTTAAQIQVPSASGYTTYYYLNDGYDLEKNDGTVAPGWCNMGGNLVSDEFIPGVAAWFKSVPGDGTATISGAVSDESSKTVDCPVGFALRANVFPIAVTLNTNSMTSDNIVGVDYDDQDVWMTTAPQIQVPSANGYTTYYYLNDGYDLEKNDGSVAPGWCNMGGNLVKDTIPAGQGFWTKGVTGAFSLKFTK